MFHFIVKLVSTPLRDDKSLQSVEKAIWLCLWGDALLTPLLPQQRKMKRSFLQEQRAVSSEVAKTRRNTGSDKKCKVSHQDVLGATTPNGGMSTVVRTIEASDLPSFLALSPAATAAVHTLHVIDSSIAERPQRHIFHPLKGLVAVS